MAHYSKLDKIVIDAPSETHDDELAFWQSAVGKEFQHFEQHPEYHGVRVHGLGVLVQHLGEGPAKVHLDFHTDNVEAEVTRLEKLGATRVQDVGGLWWIMRDPAGLLFCVIGEQPGRLDDSNATLWE
ncbi:VOC family protein [Nonomuraea soli]|uniref:Glyoxalase-like domain-containing protein n=1 Tax=Nonomuraea soli TaxID=1032476 RepID=A0A7W0CUE9_9ACTN|nr:VOC family protein [Nonomuraea soli]MBA2897559.1 hypothetical protein [Nonomuraea soli]